MELFIFFILGVGLLIGLIIITRLFGAWMLRIDEVIKHQKIMIEELRKQNQSK